MVAKGSSGCSNLGIAALVLLIEGIQVSRFVVGNMSSFAVGEPIHTQILQKPRPYQLHAYLFGLAMLLSSTSRG